MYVVTDHAEHAGRAPLARDTSLVLGCAAGLLFLSTGCGSRLSLQAGGAAALALAVLLALALGTWRPRRRAEVDVP
jgi:flavin-dependent dehydrogenase